MTTDIQLFELTPRTNAAAEATLKQLESCKSAYDYKQAVKDMVARLIETSKKLERELALMEAGRADDQDNYKTATLALDGIACDYEHMTRRDMVKKAQHTLCNLGLWRKVNPGEFAQHGAVLSVAEPSNEKAHL